MTSFPIRERDHRRPGGRWLPLPGRSRAAMHRTRSCAHRPGLKNTRQNKRRCKWYRYIDMIIYYIYIYLDNPPVQNYRSKSETAINIAGCLNFRRFQFFSPSQFPQFRLLIVFAVSSGFFAVSLGFFAVSKPANACKMTNIQKLFGGRKTCRQQ